jgi:hypothetical protein
MSPFYVHVCGLRFFIYVQIVSLRVHTHIKIAKRKYYNFTRPCNSQRLPPPPVKVPAHMHEQVALQSPAHTSKSYKPTIHTCTCKQPCSCHTHVHAHRGKKLRSFEELPAYIKEQVARKAPHYRHAPTELKPNQTGWGVWKALALRVRAVRVHEHLSVCAWLEKAPNRGVRRL